jgi:hypothetical protein
MLLAIASGASLPAAFCTIAVASVVAGFVGHGVAGQMSRLPLVRRRSERYRPLLDRVLQRHGYRAALVASITPVPFSVLCYLAGLSGTSRSFVSQLAVYRVIKLLGFFALIYFGW